MIFSVVLLQWQEFATRLAVFILTCHSGAGAGYRISVGVKARVVNQKQVDVAA